MNKLVYLSELDSIIYTKEDLKSALDKLYQVLVDDLDIVVLTINQIADSALFNLWLEEKKDSNDNKSNGMYDILIELMLLGRIIIAKQEGYVTAKEYIIKKYQDPKFISSFMKHIGCKEWTTDLKKEVRDKYITALNCCNTSVLDSLNGLDKDKIELLKLNVNFVIDISRDNINYVDLKNKNEKSLTHILNSVIELMNFSGDTTIEGVDTLICAKELERYMNDEFLKNTENRSPWLTRVVNDFEAIKYALSDNDNANYKAIVIRREKIKNALIKIINACYNINAECSIDGLDVKKEEYMNKIAAYNVSFDDSKNKQVKLNHSDVFDKEIKKKWNVLLYIQQNANF